jgi:hypothetical protein
MFDHLVMQMKELGHIADMPDDIVEHNHQVWKKLRNNVKILEIVAKFEEGRKRKCSQAMVSKIEESTIKSRDEKRTERSICIPVHECLLD